MGVNQIDVFRPQKPCQLSGTPPVQAGLPTEHVDREPVIPQCRPEFAFLVEAGKHESVSVAQLTGEPVGEDFRPAYGHPVQHLANGLFSHDSDSRLSHQGFFGRIGEFPLADLVDHHGQ